MLLLSGAVGWKNDDSLNVLDVTEEKGWWSVEGFVVNSVQLC